MILGRVKDMVRLGIGRDDLQTDMLTYFLESGLRMIEKESSFYWTQDSVDFNLTANDRDYTISSSPISVSNYKDSRILLFKKSTDDVYSGEVPYGEKDALDRIYSTTSTEDGAPEAYYVDEDDVLWLYPFPDLAYNMRWFYYKWSSLPTANTSESHEVLKRFPEALINAAIAAGIQWFTHDDNLVQPWLREFKRELHNIVLHDHRRRQNDNISLYPATGPHVNPPVLKYRSW